jgi:hypothetical protein
MGPRVACSETGFRLTILRNRRGVVAVRVAAGSLKLTCTARAGAAARRLLFELCLGRTHSNAPLQVSAQPMETSFRHWLS